MLQLAFIFVFIASVASATFGVLMSNSLRRKHHEQAIFSTLLYQQIFVFIFALYSIWGFIFFKVVFSTELISASLVEKISAVQIIIAVPFQLFSWWFLIQLMFELVQIKNNRRSAAIALATIILIIIPVYLLFHKNTSGFHHSVSPIFCMVNGLIFSLIITVLIFFKSTYLKTRQKILILFIIIGVGILLCAGTVYYSKHTLLTLLFILLFFTLNLWPVLLFARFVSIPLKSNNYEELPNLETLCRRYEISKRESEIIRCICEGKSNQEIADELFISLQTVKDHSSRIYLKTEVRNRTQLSNLFRGNIKK